MSLNTVSSAHTQRATAPLGLFANTRLVLPYYLASRGTPVATSVQSKPAEVVPLLKAQRSSP